MLLGKKPLKEIVNLYLELEVRLFDKYFLVLLEYFNDVYDLFLRIIVLVLFKQPLHCSQQECFERAVVILKDLSDILLVKGSLSC